MGQVNTKIEDGGWGQLVAAVGRIGGGASQLDGELERIADGRQRRILVEVCRQWLVAEGLVGELVKKKVRSGVMGILRILMAEAGALEAGVRGRVVDHAVRVGRVLGYSERECGFVNAVGRRLVERLEAATGEGLLERTHPQWLVARWRATYGEVGLRRLLEWNQGESPLYICTETPVGAPTQWAGYRSLRGAAVVEGVEIAGRGEGYIQDPFARIPVALLGVSAGETVLDVCAAPGGKTYSLLRKVGAAGRVVAVDRPGRRLERLQANAARWGFGERLEVVGRDIMTERLAVGPVAAVCIDVPCSNTGVIRRRPDVKIRLRPQDIAAQAAQQLVLLARAAEAVAVGGRLVYSTCSLEREENAGVVEAFVARNGGFEMVEQVLSLPWEAGHDGGGAFLMRRRA